MERRSERMSEQLAEIRKDWEQKRADPNVPGAPPSGEQSDDAAVSDEPESPGPEAPPPESHPARAEAPAETAVGPPADEPSADD